MHGHARLPPHRCTGCAGTPSWHVDAHRQDGSGCDKHPFAIMLQPFRPRHRQAPAAGRSDILAQHRYRPAGFNKRESP